MKKTFDHNATDLARVRLPADLDALLHELCKDLLAERRIDGCEVNLVNDAGTALVTAHLQLPQEFAGIQATYLGFQYQLDQPDANTQVFNSVKPSLVTADNLDRFGDTTRMRFERWKMHSLLVLPLFIRHEDGRYEAIGTLTAFSQALLLGNDILVHCEGLADLYAPLVRLHWRCQQAAERNKLAQVLHAEIDQFISYIARMNSLTAVDQVFASIGNGFIQRFGLDMVTILLAEEGELALAHTSFSDGFAHLADKWERLRASLRYSLRVRDGQSALIFLNNQRLMVQDAMKVLHLPMAEKDRQVLSFLQSPRTYLIVPIRLNGEAIGVMWLVTLTEPREFPETDLAQIELLTSFIGTAIRNAQAHMTVEAQNRKIESLNHELENKIALLDQIARKDRLTGLNNFGSFEEELKRRTSECARAGSEGMLSMILLDIDYFKPFNDTHGHPAGNQVLQAVAARIMTAVRDMDFVARYGGEEFAVLLPQCDLEGAALIAERIRAKITEAPIVAGSSSHGITISGGCAQLSAGESAETFISRVDLALYAAKHHGRDRIEKALPAA